MSEAPFLSSLHALCAGQSLSQGDAARAVQIMLHGGATPAQIAGWLVAMQVKGPTPAEIAGAAQAMRARMVRLEAPARAIDVCGTGGDGKHGLNVSTAVAFVVAACGVPVAKHGNRAVSSRAGSADVLEALGVATKLDGGICQRLLNELGLAFLFAPMFHPALRHVGPIRQELGMRTLFNLLGPLANPAGVTRQLVGVYAPELVRPVAEALQLLGVEYAWVVHGGDGSDELSLTGDNQLAIVTPDGIEEHVLNAAELGLTAEGDLQGGDAMQNARMLEQLLARAPGAYRDTVLLNAGAALCVAGRAADFGEGVEIAREAIDSGRAQHLLAEMCRLSQDYAQGAAHE